MSVSLLLSSRFIYNWKSSDVELDEYKVISDFYCVLYDEADFSSIPDSLLPNNYVISDSTLDYPIPNDSVLHKIEKGLGFSLPHEMVIDFQRKNRERYKLYRLFDLPLPYSFYTEKDSREIDSWSQFYDKFPKSTGLINFSRVGFNQDRSKALFYRGESGGALAGAGIFFYLEKSNGRWRLVADSQMWIS